MYEEKNIGIVKNIIFKSKLAGVQIGNVITVEYSTPKKILNVQAYFVKSHQSGSTISTKSTKKMDLKEIFVYKFLEILNFGPEVHFFFDPANKNDFYVLSKNLGFCFFMLPELVLNVKIFQSNSEVS